MNVLIAEDSWTLADDYRHILGGLGHSVVMVSDSAQAIALLTGAHTFDAVITDYQMPGKDGLELIEAISKLALKPPTLIQSSNTKFADGSLVADIGKRFGFARGAEKKLRRVDVEKLFKDFLDSI